MGEFKPYYVVIFTSVKSRDLEGYEEMDRQTFDLVGKQKGYLGAESFTNDQGRDVTIVMFENLADIQAWKDNPLHSHAQEMGRKQWYDFYNVKVCKVEREYEFNR